MRLRNHPKSIIFTLILIGAIAYTYSWTYTDYGRLDYRAAVSLHLLSFERPYKPDPTSDFEFELPINLIYAFSGLLPKAEMAKIADVEIAGDGGPIPARVYWPQSLSAESTPPALIVYFHGGGFMVGSVDIFDPLARSIAKATESIVLSVDYRLAPAHPYPAAVNDAYSALQWAAANAGELGADGNKLIVAGDSAGGNLATVTALQAKDRNGPAITAQILYYPVTDLSAKIYPSTTHFIDGYGLSTKARIAFNTSYIGHIADPTHPYISPLYAENLSSMPPALIVTAGFDPLTDGVNAYIKRLKESGVNVTAQHYSDTIHGFMSVGLFSQQKDALEATRTFLLQAL